MEDIVWTMRQRSRTLQDYRKDIRKPWQDEASKMLNRRYLDPHEDDSQEMVNFLQQQVEGLEKANLELVKAKDYAKEAERYSQQVEYYLELEKQEVKQAYHSYDLSLEYYAATQAELPTIERLLNQANSCCS